MSELLPVNVDAAYIDNDADPTVKIHQQHHDALHDKFNRLRIPYVVKRTRTSGNFPLGNVATWTQIDPDENGTHDARPMDLVIPDVDPGEWVTLDVSILFDNGAGSVKVDAATIVAGTIVNRVSGANGGVPAWSAWPGDWRHAGGSWSYQVKANDIEDNYVRFRIVYTCDGTRSVYAGEPWPLSFEGRGPTG